MANSKTVLITGAAGNLGSKLRKHLDGRCPLRLMDIDPRGDTAIIQVDLSRWDESWVRKLEGVHTVVHLAADPTADQTWEKLIAPNVDAVINIFEAAARNNVRRVVYASSNHAMGRYQDLEEPHMITTDIPPLPGAIYTSNGQKRESTPYGSAKLMGERIGKCYSDFHGMSVIAVRIGWVRPGENLAKDIPEDRAGWFRSMWLSNRDFCHLFEQCIEADPAIHFAVINGMSANRGMRWDIEYTTRLVGYKPQDDVFE